MNALATIKKQRLAEAAVHRYSKCPEICILLPVEQVEYKQTAGYPMQLVVLGIVIVWHIETSHNSTDLKDVSEGNSKHMTQNGENAPSNDFHM